MTSDEQQPQKPPTSCSSSLRQILDEQYLQVERFANAQTRLFNSAAVWSNTSSSSSASLSLPPLGPNGQSRESNANEDHTIRRAVEQLDEARRGVRMNWIKLQRHPKFSNIATNNSNKAGHCDTTNQNSQHHLSDHLALSRRVVQTINMNPKWHPNGLPAGNLTTDNIRTNTVALTSLKASITNILQIEQEP